MKKNVIKIFILILVMLSCNLAFADFNSQLKNHWAGDIVDKQFVEKYFDYLTDEDYSSFEPDSNISLDSFKSSLDGLLSGYSLINTDKDIDLAINGEETEPQDNERVLRKDAIKMIVDIFGDDYQNIELPFSDIKELSEEYRNAVAKAYRLGIIKGHSNQKFCPEEPVSQIQAIILLGRLEKILIDTIRDIPYKIISTELSYEGKEGITIESQEDKVLITITRQFPNPGYDMEITNVKKLLGGKYKIYTKIIKPHGDRMYAQVISYRSITIEIAKEFLEEEYQFDLDFPVASFTKSK